MLQEMNFSSLVTTIFFSIFETELTLNLWLKDNFFDWEAFFLPLVDTFSHRLFYGVNSFFRTVFASDSIFSLNILANTGLAKNFSLETFLGTKSLHFLFLNSFDIMGFQIISFLALEQSKLTFLIIEEIRSLLVYTLIWGGLLLGLNSMINLEYEWLTEGQEFLSLITAGDSEADKEVGSLEDFILLSSIYLILIGYYFNAVLVYSLDTIYDVSILIYFLWLINFFTVNMANSQIYDMGLFPGSYLRGVSLTEISFFEMFKDGLYGIVIYMRILLQNMRILLVFLAFLEIEDWVFNYTGNFSVVYPLEFSFSSFFLSDSFTKSSFFFSIQFFVELFWLGYVAAHLLSLCIGQAAVYFLMLYWLFFFLYSSFFWVQMESFFKFKRSSNKF